MGVQVGDEAVLGVVGAGDDLRLAVEGGEGGDRAEGLLVHDQGVVGHVGEDGRGVEDGRRGRAGVPPVRRRAPLATASSTWASCLATARAVISGPMSGSGSPGPAVSAACRSAKRRQKAA